MVARPGDAGVSRPLVAAGDRLRYAAMPATILVSVGGAEVDVEIAVRAVVALVVALVLIRLTRPAVDAVISPLFRREATEGTSQDLTAIELKRREETIESFATNVIRALIVLIAIAWVLQAFGLDIGPAIAGLGVVGIAVGFGAQSLVRDYFTGALILIENQYAKGDVVSIAGVTGTVEDFSLRRTTLRDIDGVVHTVPNGQITVTSNRTRTWARVNENVMVSYGTDIERATEIADEVGAQLAADRAWKGRVLERPKVERVEALGEYGVTLKILGSVKAGEQWSVGGELRKRLLAAFRANGIEIPDPRRVLYAGSGPPAASEPRTGGGPSEDELAESID
jgi:small-conductance mechanosensitive channel